MAKLTENEFRAIAETKLRKPYIWGASGPDSFDCSGFVEWLLKQLGMAPPGRETAAGLHDYYSRSGMGVPVPLTEVGLGDLCFYMNDKNHVSHVTMGWGDGRVIEAGKGDQTCTTEARAKKMGAEVMISDMHRHPRLLDAKRPVGLPWR